MHVFQMNDLIYQAYAERGCTVALGSVTSELQHKHAQGMGWPGSQKAISRWEICCLGVLGVDGVVGCVGVSFGVIWLNLK